MLNQSKWIPLHLVSGGLVLGFELDGADTAFAETGLTLEITDVKLFANLHTIDSALANSYASHVCFICTTHQSWRVVIWSMATISPSLWSGGSLD